MSIQRATIDLTGAPLPDGAVDTDRPGWWRDGATLSVRGELGQTVYKLPTGRPVVGFMRLGGGRAQLKIGGFKTTTVVVNGPHDQIRKLYEEVL